MPPRRWSQTSAATFLVASLLTCLAAGGTASAGRTSLASTSARPVHVPRPSPDGAEPGQRSAADRASTLGPFPAVAPTSPPAAAPRSWYVDELSGVVRADAARARARGCAQARTAAPGLVTLGFGRQTAGGVSAYNRHRPTPMQHVVTITAAFAEGLEQCRTRSGRWVILLAVSNYGGATRSNGAQGGADWALVVEVAARMSAGNAHVVVGGAVDMEPAWGPPAQGRAWVDAYVRHTDRLLVNVGSADLCPRKPGGIACANGWTQDDVIHVSTAAGPSVWVVPEVYDHKGIMAGQWVSIARRAERLGTPLRFAGVMTQQAACAGSTEPACARLNLSPADAWTALVGGLDAAHVRRTGPFLSTDIGWGWHSATSTGARG